MVTTDMIKMVLRRAGCAFRIVRSNPRRSRPGMPWHSHIKAEPVQPGEIVPVEIEILASSTIFEAGSTLHVDIFGHDADRYPAFRHEPTVNLGWHTIYSGATYNSLLLIPIVNRSKIDSN